MRLKSLLVFTAIATCIIGCKNKDMAVEKLIPADNVEILGSDARSIRIAGDSKVFMVTDSQKSKWTIQALIPIQSTMEIQGIDEIAVAKLDILDANCAEIDKDFGLLLQNEAQVIALFDSPAGTVKNVIFEPYLKEYSYKEYKVIVDYIGRTDNLVLNLKIGDNASKGPVSSTPKVYSFGYDGFVNVRQEPSFSAKVVGELRNGPEGAELLEDSGQWKKIDLNGIIGYVPSNFVQETPTESYTGTATTAWVQGIWRSNSDEYLYIYNNGTWVYEDDDDFSYGLYVLQNNEVKFTPVWQSFSRILPIDQENNRLGAFQKISVSGDHGKTFKAYRLNYNNVFAQYKDGANTCLLKQQGSSSNTSISGGSSSNWDSLLEQYEKCVNQCISLYKKMQNGDSAAMTEYMKYLEDVQKLAEKLEGASNDMTMEQANKFVEIQKKLINAIGGL